jgi:hypothetical protein
MHWGHEPQPIEDEDENGQKRQSSAAFLQTNAHEVFDGCLGAEDGLGLANRIVGVDLFESKGHQSENGVIDLLLVG